MTFDSFLSSHHFAEQNRLLAAGDVQPHAQYLAAATVDKEII
jgi:hypothetical protein